MLAPIPTDFEPTRATLHAYALAVSAVARTHAEPHPKWWHVALSVSGHQWSTDPIPLPGGGEVTLRFDLDDHELRIDTDAGKAGSISLDQGLTGTEFGERIIAELESLGLAGVYDRDRFATAEPRIYNREVAAAFADILATVAGFLRSHMLSVEGETGRVNLWPHGFDLAVEWFGTRVEHYDEDGEVAEHQAQINLGFYPGGRPYFYSNPWPFEREVLLVEDLPHGAEWHVEGWEGSVFHYDILAGDPDAAAKLSAYAKTVHEHAAPTLTAD